MNFELMSFRSKEASVCWFELLQINFRKSCIEPVLSAQQCVCVCVCSIADEDVRGKNDIQMPRGTLEFKEDKLTEEQRKSHSEELHSLYLFPNITR